MVFRELQLARRAATLSGEAAGGREESGSPPEKQTHPQFLCSFLRFV